MIAEQIAERVQARPAGPDRWRTRCPVHGGKSLTSLSIARGEDGRVLVKCWSGCTVENICAALGIKVADLFPEPGTYQPKTREVVHAEKQIQNLRSRLTPRERTLPITIIETDLAGLDAAIARGLALSTEQELVQIIMIQGAA